MDQDKPVLLVNPGGRVVEVTPTHAEQLLAADDGFKKAPKASKEGDFIGNKPTEPTAQNDLVPNGTDEDEAKRIADLQGTPENAKLQAAADPSNDTVQSLDETEKIGNKGSAGLQTQAEKTQTPEPNKAAKFFGRGKKNK